MTPIRLLRLDELATMQDIERAAGEPFRPLGMASIAEDEPPSVEDLASFARDARAWVATDAGDHPVAYLLADVVDGCAHVEQVSVHPAHAGRGLGRALLDHVEVWARGRGLSGLTLTTFANVPWNAPYYSRLGFTVLGEHDLTDGLRRIRADEARRGLDRWPRVMMRRALRGDGE